MERDYSNNELYKAFLTSGTQLTYVEWIEDEYRKLKIWAEVAKGWLPFQDDDDPDYDVDFPMRPRRNPYDF